MTDSLKCLAKHLPDVPDEEFVCPKCGAESGDWCIDYSHNQDCTQLVADDDLICSKCGHGESAKDFVARWKKAKSLVTCPTCQGSGVVKKEESDG